MTIEAHTPLPRAPARPPSLSRRSLVPLGALATLAALAWPDRAGRAAPLSESPDAALLALGREWRASAEECAWLDDALDEASGRMLYPEPPEALFRRKSDWFHFFGFYGHQHHDDRYWYGYPASIDHLREMSCIATNGAHEWVDEAKRNRRDEVVGAYDRWRVEIEAASEACGLTAADRASKAAHDRSRELRSRIISLPATTLAGALLKLEIARWCCGDELEESLAERLQDGGPTDVTMLYAFAVDMARISDQACIGKAA